MPAVPTQALSGIEIPPELSPEEREALIKRLAALKILLENKEAKAKYKIEVIFNKARSTTKPTPGIMSFWESGAQLHGGGDSKIYFCPGKELKRNTCEAPLPVLSNAGDTHVCVACGNIWKGEEVIGEIFCNLTMRNWAQAIYNYYRRLDHNCDIYLKHATDDIRSIALAQAEKQTWKGSELLDKVRSKRARHIYPLRNIIKETSNGADVLTRFYAFLVA